MCSNMISDSILQLTFKKLPLVGFWYRIKEDHNYKKTKRQIKDPRYLLLNSNSLKRSINI